MRILICGASGFVGRHLTSSLREAGHNVIRALRNPVEPNDIAVDFCNDTAKQIWLARLKGFDAVINAVGILRDNRNNPMQKLHAETPLALFAACAEIGIERVVHISALGVDSGICVPYFTTRLLAERTLQALPENVHWLCLRPSVIYGEDGESAKMFRNMAKLPIQVLPMGGKQTLQPVHIDDICAAIAHWLLAPNATSQIVEAVGAEATTMRGMLDSYREQMHRNPAIHVTMPANIVRLLAKIGDYFPASPLCSDTYSMMAADNTASTSKLIKLLENEPRSYKKFIS
jgi:uncharacterized protein YbjT (DUF2867 family)